MSEGGFGFTGCRRDSESLFQIWPDSICTTQKEVIRVLPVQGWNYYDTIKELENKRKERAQVAYERRKQLAKLRVKAEKAAEEKLGPQFAVIAPIKY
ncbi:60s ribosomal protein l13a-1 [Nicotiana attenuata]|uniref:60s ribosomal protein l13a-1 n=1 Tax=Nicotiana attenuata TaxID=49451 RepID=A0A314KGS0_NICAT|nr:60s ribosomal protein l13a-1 [Nicotiana attenuata]